MLRSSSVDDATQDPTRDGVPNPTAPAGGDSDAGASANIWPANETAALPLLRSYRALAIVRSASDGAQALAPGADASPSSPTESSMKPFRFSVGSTRSGSQVSAGTADRGDPMFVIAEACEPGS
jgi:hypothetical protein